MTTGIVSCLLRVVVYALVYQLPELGKCLTQDQALVVWDVRLP